MSLLFMQLSAANYTNVAICVIGAPRTLSHTANNIAKSFAQTKVRSDYFILLRKTQYSEHNSKEQISHYDKLSWLELSRAIAHLTPLISIRNSSTKFSINPNCELPRDAMKLCDKTNQPSYQRLWETMIGFTECFADLKKHEYKIKKQYTTIIRLRPDTFFYDTINPMLLSPTVPIFPYGHISCTSTKNDHVCVNDHIAFLPRIFADRYLEMADRYTHCNTKNDTIDQHKFWKQYVSNKWTLARTIVLEMMTTPKITWRREKVPYIILRSSNPPFLSCKRAAITHEYVTSNNWNTSECIKCVKYIRTYFHNASTDGYTKICSTITGVV